MTSLTEISTAHFIGQLYRKYIHYDRYVRFMLFFLTRKFLTEISTAHSSAQLIENVIFLDSKVQT